MESGKLRSLIYSSNPLLNDIKLFKPYKKEKIKELYGAVGVDIFENRVPNIIDKHKLTGRYKFLNKIAGFLGLKSHQSEYKKSDSFFDIWLKYVGNYGKGLVKDIHENFGKCGDEILKSWQRIGYII